MRPVQATPDEGGSRRCVHFRHVRTEFGERWEAWIAGPIQWYTCHTFRKTKPCVHKITGGQVACKFCNSVVLPIETMGFAPLYRCFDDTRVFVLLHEDKRDVASKLKLHQQITVGRGEESSDGVFLAPKLAGGHRYDTSLPDRRLPADIWPTLLKVWGVEELIEWWQAQPDTDPLVSGGVVDDRARARADGTAFSPMMQAAARRGNFPVVDEEEQSIYDDALKRAKERNQAFVDAAKNGKHKKE